MNRNSLWLRILHTEELFNQNKATNNLIITTFLSLAAINTIILTSLYNLINLNDSDI